MKSVILKSDQDLFSVKVNPSVLWIYRLELAFYFIVFTVFMYLLYTMSESRQIIRVGVIIALSLIFIVVIFKKRKSIRRCNFSLLRTGNEFFINESIRAKRIDFDLIQVNEMVSTYSASGYYDISLPVGSSTIPIAFGISESEKDELLNSLKNFIIGTGSM